MSRLVKTFVFAWLGTLLLTCPISRAHAQNVNDGFAPAVDDQIDAMAIQADGKILIGGNFTHVGSTSRTKLARLNPDGSVDTSFAVTIGGSYFVNAIAVQANGQILIGGRFTTVGTTTVSNIARLNTDGSVDTTFNPMADSVVYCLTVQSNGQILVGGEFVDIAGQPRTGIARLNANGSIDLSFVPPDLGTLPAMAAILVQPDGSIVLGGFNLTVNSNPVFILRLLPNGTLDGNFQTVTNGGVNALALQANGEILIGGNFSTVNGVTLNNLAQVYPNGSLDPAFVDNGLDVNNYVLAITVQPNGPILIGGAFTQVNGSTRNQVARIGADGTLGTFNPNVNGANSHGTGPYVNELALQSDNELLMAGGFANVGSTARSNIARIDIDGELDATLDLAMTSTVNAIAAQADGSLLIGGTFTAIGSATRHSVARVLADGALDTYNPNANSSVNDVAVEADGSALISGMFTAIGGHAQAYLAHLSSGGSVDTSFRPVFDNIVSNIALQTNGQILVSGIFTQIDGASHIGFARLNADGGVDTAFAAIPNGSVRAIAVQANGQILVGGQFSQIGGQSAENLARVNADGSLDTSFATTLDNLAEVIAVQENGKILIAGPFTMVDGQACSGLARLNANGSLDSSFALTAIDSHIDSMIELTDGKILISGSFQHVGGQSHKRLARLNANGSVDASFADLGVDGEVSALAVARDGKIAAGGTFSSVGGQARADLARLSIPEAALQSLSVSGNQTVVTWLRSGAGQILAVPPTLLFSADGSTFAPLGTMTQISGGWQCSVAQPLADQPYYLRVRAQQAAGLSNGSQSGVQYTAEFYLNDDIFQNGFEN